MSGDLLSHLMAIRERHGELTAQPVVDEARDPLHPLHPQFEWNDTIGGEEYRLIQARRLIRSVRIDYQPAGEKGPARSVRAFVSVESAKGRAYEPVEEVANDPFTHLLVMNQMEREWRALYNRYKEFEDFLTMVRGDVLADL